MSKKGIVYSTDEGRMCPECERPVLECSCSALGTIIGDGEVRVRLETKGRKGKCVTLITGLPLDQLALKELGKELKNKCGSGGSVKNGAIEIQGDHCDLILKELSVKGWSAKRSG